MEFFDKGTLLKQVNSTQISLIAKNDTPDRHGDYRPIACCNVLCKTISKVLCNRLTLVLLEIVSLN